MRMKFLLPLVTSLTLTIASLASAEVPMISREQRKACNAQQTMVLKQLIDAKQVTLAVDDPVCSRSGDACNMTADCCGADQCINKVCVAVSYGGDDCSKYDETCTDSMDCCGGGVCQEGICK